MVREYAMDKANNNRSFSVKKFVDQLLAEGGKASCDETNKDFDRNGKEPQFYDQRLYKRGQQFFHKHIFAMFLGKVLGLLSVLAVPTILKILIFTKMSGSTLTAYRRYVATILHMMIWYDEDFKPGSKLWKSITQVRNLHNSASKRSCNAGMTTISQRDMALTQFGFMGFALARTEWIGIHGATEEELEGFVHVWRVVGYLMGIEDRFNICNGTAEETRDICNLLIERVYLPEVEKKDKDFLSMSYYLIKSLWVVDPTIQFKPTMCGLHILLHNTDSIEELRYKPTYMKLRPFQTVQFYIANWILDSLKFNMFRLYHNTVRKLSLWLIRVFPLLAYMKFGIKQSYAHINL